MIAMIAFGARSNFPTQNKYGTWDVSIRRRCMIVLDYLALTGLAAMITAVAALIWSIRRKP